MSFIRVHVPHPKRIPQGNSCSRCWLTRLFLIFISLLPGLNVSAQQPMPLAISKLMSGWIHRLHILANSNVSALLN